MGACEDAYVGVCVGACVSVCVCGHMSLWERACVCVGACVTVVCVCVSMCW